MVSVPPPLPLILPMPRCCYCDDELPDDCPAALAGHYYGADELGRIGRCLNYQSAGRD